MVAMAIFGESSYISTRSTNPTAYEMITEQEEMRSADNGQDSSNICYDLWPLASLGNSQSGFDTTDLGGCIRLENPGDIPSQIARWLTIFLAGPADPDAGTHPMQGSYLMQSTLTAALYLSNGIWLKQGVSGASRTLNVNYDPGAPTTIPTISTVGIITVSILLGLFVLGLFAMAGYASHMPAWTSALNFFTVMQMGAAAAEHLPLSAGSKADKVKVLDEVPGWIGDAMPEAGIGKLGLGAKAKLRSSRKYECYKEREAMVANRSGYTEISAA